MFFDCRFDLCFLGAEGAPHGVADAHAGKPVRQPGCGGIYFHLEGCIEFRTIPVAPDMGLHGIAEQGAFGLVEFDHRVNAARGDRDVLGEGGVTRADVGVCDLQHQGVDLAAFPRFKRS